MSVRRWQKNDVPRDLPNDIAFTKQLLNDMDTVLCFDIDKVHAVGLGTGAGMVHLMACDPELSTRIASFATVAGGYGHPKKGGPWKSCNPGRVPIPMLSIHGDEDKILPYLLNEWEPAKNRLAVPAWLDEWSERNGCGEPVSEPLEATDGTGTEVRVTQLEGGGWSSEGEAFNGGALRIAKSCPRPGKGKAEVNLPVGTKKEDEPKDEPNGEDNEGEQSTGNVKATGRVKEQILATNPKDFTILHYRVRNYGHGWPTLQIKGTKSSKAKERFFDATAMVLDWFEIHELPIDFVAGDESKKAEFAAKMNKNGTQEKMKFQGKNEDKSEKDGEEVETRAKEDDTAQMDLTEDGGQEDGDDDERETPNEKVEEKEAAKEKEEKERDEL
jgi:poly(3-hydroxybutyrate) depolymerase